MVSFEQLFSSALLDVLVPDTNIEYPPQCSADEWLKKLRSGRSERSQAFFDEQLRAFLIVRIDHNSSGDSEHPPEDLLLFLAHVQVTFEASYISAVPTAVPDFLSPRSSMRLSAPPKRDSLQARATTNSPGPHHPSILPPATPNPTPSSADNDRRYVMSEGTPLSTTIWGQNTSQDEDFTLLWSEIESAWVAVYKLSQTVSFLRIPFSEPLLALTVSATLRDKPLLLSQNKNPLLLFLADSGVKVSSSLPSSPIVVNGQPVEPAPPPDLGGFEEVNLLEGLSMAPSFTLSSLSLPSSRLGQISRNKLFAMPIVAPPTPALPTPSPMTAVRTAHPTLRKSFRKTLKTVSGFRVRMRTVFVPSVLFHLNDTEDEEREAGNEERSVVLCVEIENSGEAGKYVGFQVERVDVRISGEGASTTLIGWNDATQGNSTFPLRVGSKEQFNILYAVTFLRSPAEVESLTTVSADPGSVLPGAELQRAVSINMFGKPYVVNEDDDILYPTHTFSSRWNCILDLSSHQQPVKDPSDLPRLDPMDPTSSNPEVLPQPPSPFPATITSATMPSPSPSSPLVTAGSFGKRHTLSALPRRSSLGPKSASSYRASTPVLSLPSSPFIPANTGEPRERATSLTLGGKSYIPPSISVQIPKSPTTYEPPPERLPMTPAYPAYTPHTASPQPMEQVPLGSQASMNYIGPSIEIPRQRGSGIGIAATPGPYISSAFEQQQMMMDLPPIPQGEPIVVSVGLIETSEDGRVFPLDNFTLDIFVFNRSEWTRRFEVSCPRKGRDEAGVLAMENRVRIGPLPPSACQSVRMRFLAITPGVHCIDTLTLTDIESGFSINLRSVMDVVVHERVS